VYPAAVLTYFISASVMNIAPTFKRPSPCFYSKRFICLIFHVIPSVRCDTILFTQPTPAEQGTNGINMLCTLGYVAAFVRYHQGQYTSMYICMYVCMCVCVCVCVCVYI
jgi:hypothetical protein